VRVHNGQTIAAGSTKSHAHSTEESIMLNPIQWQVQGTARAHHRHHSHEQAAGHDEGGGQEEEAHVGGHQGSQRAQRVVAGLRQGAHLRGVGGMRGRQGRADAQLCAGQGTALPGLQPSDWVFSWCSVGSAGLTWPASGSASLPRLSRLRITHTARQGG